MMGQGGIGGREILPRMGGGGVWSEGLGGLLTVRPLPLKDFSEDRRERGGGSRRYFGFLFEENA